MNGTEIIDAVNKLIAVSDPVIRKFKGIMTIGFSKVVQDRECGIINKKTHTKGAKAKGGDWVCCWKDGDKKHCFDSFGKKPPLKWLRYLRNNVVYNKIRIQNYDDNICGELRVKVLKLLSDGDSFSKTLDLINMQRK